MTRLRLRVAERLKGAQNTYAMLTTFNEVDMTGLMEMRNEYKVGGDVSYTYQVMLMCFLRFLQHLHVECLPLTPLSFAQSLHLFFDETDH
jgi:hypothetical protein